jgi:hypothetical protein
MLPGGHNFVAIRCINPGAEPR